MAEARPRVQEATERTRRDVLDTCAAKRGENEIIPGLAVTFDESRDGLLKQLHQDEAGRSAAAPASGSQFIRCMRGQEQELARGFDRLLALDELDLRLFDHQRQAVLRVLRDMRGRALLADEVGLGKTIEAGVIAKEYIVRGLARSLLVLAPASLTAQWRHELNDKVDLPCHVFAPGDSWQDRELVITSLDTARRPEHAAVLQTIPWDIVIVDEAHRLKNRHTRSWQLVDSLQKKYMLLLTATPIQNDLEELYNMMTLLQPGLLQTYRSFKQEFVADRRFAKQVERLRARIGQTIVRTTRAAGGLHLPKRCVRTVSVPLNESERSFYQCVLTFARSAYATGGAGAIRPNVLPLILLLRELCSSPEAVQQTLRSLSGSDALLSEQRGQARELAATAQTLCGRSSKLQSITNWIDTVGEPAVVFTQFRATQRALLGQLEARAIPASIFHGSMTAAEKLAAVAQFRRDGGVLVSTEAGSEGQNLQFCRTVINCDLPWNPMRVEQRIGRVHRLGQTKDVVIVNVLAPDTMEMHVFRLLHEKIRLFEQVVGELDVILDQNGSRGLLPGVAFERALGAIFLGEEDEHAANVRLAAIGESAVSKARRLLDIRRLNEQLLPSAGTEEVVDRDPSPAHVPRGDPWERNGEADVVPVTNRLLHPLCLDTGFARAVLAGAKSSDPVAESLRRREQALQFVNGHARAIGRRIVHHSQWIFVLCVAYRSDETREHLYTVAVDPLTEEARLVELPDEFVDVCLNDLAEAAGGRSEQGRVKYCDGSTPVSYAARRLYAAACTFLGKFIQREEGAQHVLEAAARLARDKGRLDDFYQGLEEEALVPVIQQWRRLQLRRTRARWQQFVAPAPSGEMGGDEGADVAAIARELGKIRSDLRQDRRRRLEELAIKYSVRADVRLVGAARMTAPRVQLMYKLLAPVRREVTFYYDPLRDAFVDLECDACGQPPEVAHVTARGGLMCSTCAAVAAST